MSATVGDPIVLSSYSLPSRTSKKGKEKATSADEKPFVFASHSGAGKKRDGLVTIAAQGDGVHILDVCANAQPFVNNSLLAYTAVGPSSCLIPYPRAVNKLCDSGSDITFQCRRKDLSEYIRRCPICSRYRDSRRREDYLVVERRR